jgi:hypothetical protein
MSTLRAVQGTAPDPPCGEFDIEAVPEDGTRRKVPLASATRIPFADITRWPAPLPPGPPGPGYRPGPVIVFGCAISSPRALAPGRRGLSGDPVVAAFLERPLELGERGADRLVSFPVCLRGPGKRPVNVCWACSEERLRVPGSSPAGGRLCRLVFGTGISFL